MAQHPSDPPRPERRARSLALTILMVVSVLAVVPASPAGAATPQDGDQREDPPGTSISALGDVPPPFPEDRNGDEPGFGTEADVGRFIVGFVENGTNATAPGNGTGGNGTTGDGNATNVTLPEPGDTLHGALVLVVNEELRFVRVRAQDPANFLLQAGSDPDIGYVRRYDPTRFKSFQAGNTTLDDPAFRTLFNANDPLLPDQWGFLPHPGMDAKGAWDIQRGDLTVTVAVLDTGLEKGHEDIGHYTQGYDFFALDGEPDDPCGHGTHVAGTVGALTDNGRGVGGSGRVTIMPVKVLGQPPGGGGCTGSSSAIANGITYAADHGADVISMSLGCAKGCWSQAVADAIEYAHAKGTLLISSAGNSGPCTDCVGFPANHPRVMAVSALSPDGTLATYSNTGSEVEIIAPGTRILSTYIGNRYATMSGTSMAAPHVSGAAALVLSVQDMSNKELRTHLAATTMDAGLPPTAQGAGAVHAQRAVEGAVEAANQPPVPRFKSTCTDLECTFDASASYDPDGSIARYRWSFGDGATATGRTVSHAYAEAGTFSVTLTVVDDQGVTAKLTQQVVTTAPNAPPTAAMDVSCQDLTCTFSGAPSADSDGTITAYRWELGDGATATGVSVTHTYPQAGMYPVTLTVTDDAGHTASTTKEVTVSKTPAQATVLLEETFDGTITGWRKSSGPNDLWRLTTGCIQDPEGTRVMAFARPAPDCDYDVGHAQGWVRTPAIPAGSFDVLTLGFQHIWQTESNTEKPFDLMKVQVSTDGGGTWTTVRQWDSTGTNPTGWGSVSVDLAQYAQDGLMVRWFFDSKDASYNDHAGWYVDDVRIVGSSTTVTNQPPRANFTWSCQGLGCSFQANGVDGPSVDPDGELASFSWEFGGERTATGSEVAHTFAKAGTYTVTLTVADDQGATDTVQHEVTVEETAPAEQVVVSEDFDDGDVTGWRKSSGSTDLWRITSSCAPQDRASRYAAFTRSAPVCDYDVGHATGWLRAPPMDLNGALDATLTFVHTWETERTTDQVADVMEVQVSTDGGASWTPVARWTSQGPNPGGWEKVQVDLSPHATDHTLVRWRFDSRDGSFNDHAGWFVDNVRVEAQMRDLAADGNFTQDPVIVEPGENVTEDEPPADRPGGVEGDPGPFDVPAPAVPGLAVAVVLAAFLVRALRRSRGR